ncbi:MAG: hypothetical protein M3Z23_05225 [Acidobacteriota bacterium]|nr:hypothetical protein [Acidobacteriota bacterium]
MRVSIIFGFTLLGAITSSAATITSFTATPIDGSPFIATINSMFSGSTAFITNSSVSCASTTAPCSGNVLSFTIQGIGSPGATPLSVNIDGLLSGSTRALGSLNVTSPFTKSVPFSLAAGTFNTAIVNTGIPSDSTGAFSGAGTVGLSLAPGQTLTLPSSLSFAVGTASTSVPEPGSALLVGGALLGSIGMMKRGRARA